MTKRYRIPIILLLILLCGVIGSTPVLAFVDKTEDFYVADYAGVLSGELEDEIISTNDALYEMTGGQIVVVTVEYLDGYYSDEYANHLFNEWGVGDAEKNNGMLLLLATQENKYWLTQGAGISGSFDGDTIDQYLSKYFEKEFDRENYDKAVSKLFDELVKWYEGYYGVDLSSMSYTGTGTVDNAHSSATGDSFGAFRGIVLIVILVVFLIVIAVISRVVRGAFRRGPGMYGPRYYRPTNFFFFRGGRRPPPPPPPGGWGPMGGPPRSGPSHRSGPRSGGGGRSSGFGGGRSSGGGFRSGGGGRSSGGGGGRR